MMKPAKRKNIITRLIDRLDKRLEEKTKTKKCCCCKEAGDKECSKR